MVLRVSEGLHTESTKMLLSMASIQNNHQQVFVAATGAFFLRVVRGFTACFTASGPWHHAPEPSNVYIIT